MLNGLAQDADFNNDYERQNLKLIPANEGENRRGEEVIHQTELRRIGGHLCGAWGIGPDAVGLRGALSVSL